MKNNPLITEEEMSALLPAPGNAAQGGVTVRIGTDDEVSQPGVLARTGEPVAAGQTIAPVGSTGHSTGPHLRFEVTHAGRHLNPLSLLP